MASFILYCKKRESVIGISECRLSANQQNLSGISPQNYSYELTSTESSKGGTFIHIDQNVKHKIREDLNKEIESTFLGVIESNRKNIIVACLYS